MDENRTGQFIAELRKEKKITQKDLAIQLHIIDKAVSKWERGLSYPDITLLTSIAEAERTQNNSNSIFIILNNTTMLNNKYQRCKNPFYFVL